MTILASRRHLCINPAVTERPSAGACGGQPRDGNLSDKCLKAVEQDGCPFRATSRLKAALSEQPITDIEELLAKGRETKSCPYYTSRELQLTADITFATFAHLTNLRSPLLDIDHQNIVILDEGHRIVEALENSGTARYAVSELVTMGRQVTEHALDMDSADLGLANLRERMTEVLFRVASWCEEALIQQDSCGRDGGFHPVDVETWLADVVRVNCFDLQHDVELLQAAWATSEEPTLRDALNNLHEFSVYVSLLHDHPEHYAVMVTTPDVDQNAVTALEFACMSPTPVWNRTLSNARSVILASGTMGDFDLLQSRLPVHLDVRVRAQPCLRPEQYLAVVSTTDLSGRPARYTAADLERTETQDCLGQTVSAFLSVTRGSALLAFPSARSQRSVLARWEETGLINVMKMNRPFFVGSNPAAFNDYKSACEQRLGPVLVTTARGRFSEGEAVHHATSRLRREGQSLVA